VFACTFAISQISHTTGCSQLPQPPLHQSSSPSARSAYKRAEIMEISGKTQANLSETRECIVPRIIPALPLLPCRLSGLPPPTSAAALSSLACRTSTRWSSFRAAATAACACVTSNSPNLRLRFKIDTVYKVQSAAQGQPLRLRAQGRACGGACRCRKRVSGRAAP
jgi:hypothetical protein